MAIPFEIPSEMMSRYLAGDLTRNGALLREAGTGRIVAHLQETAGLARMVQAGFDPVSMVANGVQIYQNEQIKAGLAIVQNLQVANLALTGVGIGVSIVGFALLSRKLDQIESRMTELAAAIEHVAKRVQAMQAHLVRAELAALRAELRRIDEAWSRSDAEAQWRIAADRLLTLEQTFHDHARALHAAVGDELLCEQMVDAFALAGSARLSALLAAGECATAASASCEFAQSIANLTGHIGAPQLMRAMLAAEGTQADPAARLAAIERLRPQVAIKAAGLREREDAAATAPLTVDALMHAKVPAREWMARARNELEAPLICLAVEDAGAIEQVPA